MYSIFSSYPLPPHLPHRYNLSTDSDGFMSGVAEIVSINGDGLSLPFVSPASVVPKHNTTILDVLAQYLCLDLQIQKFKA